jgi:tetratricopeptide (TPR) repeat protein
MIIMTKSRFIILLFLLSALMMSCASTGKTKEIADPQVDKTIKFLKRFIKEHPEDVRGYFELGGNYFKMRRAKEATATFKDILDLKSASSGDKAYACVWLAKIEENTKDIKGALKWYEEGLRYEGGRGTYVAQNYVKLLIQMKAYEDAIMFCQRILGRKNISVQEQNYFMEQLQTLSILLKLG